MRKTTIYILAAILFVTLISAEDITKKFSVGAGTGIFKDGSEDSYRTAGNSFFGQLKYGVFKDFEVGIKGGMRYNHPAYNLHKGFPWPTRNKETGEEFKSLDWDYQHLENPYVYTGYRDDTTSGSGISAGKITFEQCDECNQKFLYYPFQLFFHFRAMSNTIFNPYVNGGVGFTNWKVVDDQTGELLQVRNTVVYNNDSTDSLIHPGYDDNNMEWQDFKGTFYTINFGLGFEVFPIENVGIDVGLQGSYLFANELADAFLDTMSVMGGVYTRLNFYYGGITDPDKDGVPSHKDKCPDTPFGAVVDEFGCPLDSDQDGVYDGIDECPETQMEASVDAQGCPLDSDKDGVPDGVDQCTGTPEGVQVDTTGCPKDDDEDGVANYEDECPNTPKEAYVESDGCPSDNDGDGVYDGIDQCPRTPKEKRVNEKGCAIQAGDSDDDGVPDDVDQCPGTPSGAWVDTTGCPKDSDNDNVPDGIDKCPSTPEGARVDYHGCKMEEKEKELVDAGKISLQGINFDFNKASIRPGSYDILDEVGKILDKYPMLKIEIAGHTDSVGSASFNKKLSKKRAQSVLDYLLEEFPEISKSNFVVKGYGENKAIADNGTEEGRQKNRRVEFKVLNKEKLKDLYKKNK